MPEMPVTSLRVPFVLAAAAALAAPLHGQGNRRDQLIAANIEALADPAKAPGAVRALEHLGPAAVPALRQLLASPRRLQEPSTRIQNALLVIGRLGERALPTVPELIDILGVDDYAEVIEGGSIMRRALWAMTQLVPFLDEQARAPLLDLIQRRGGVLFRADAVFLTIVLHHQLSFGPEPTTAMLVSSLRHAAPGVAACEHVCVRPPADPADRRKVLDMLETQLELIMARPTLHWENRDHRASVAGHFAVAWTKLAQRPPDAVVARALLTYWDVDEQLRAALWMKDNAATLPWRERGDLIALLWNASPAVADACADAFASWGKAGLVGLPALRRVQNQANDAARRARLAAAAERIVAAFAGEAEPARTLVAAIDGVLSSTPTAELAPTAVGAAVPWEDVLFGAQWCTADTAIALLDLCARAQAADRTAIASVMPWIVNSNSAVTRAALAWLARRGRAVDTALEGGELALRLAVQSHVAAEELGAGIEAIAWVAAPPGSDVATLRAALGDPELRVVCRALASLLLEYPGALAQERARLEELLRVPQDDRAAVFLAGRPKGSLDADLVPLTRLLAAVALASQNVAVDGHLATEVQPWCGVPVTELPQWVSQQRTRNALAAWLDSVEGECRRELGCVHGAWPTLAGAK